MAVYARQYGRTGNQLFQKAAAIGYAMKHSIDYRLKGDPRYKHYAIIIKETAHSFQELPFDENWRGFNDIILDGYWQSAHYFDHCREEVLKAFGFNWPHQAGVCSIHIRRGDYLLYPDKHPVVTNEYLQQAIRYISQHTGIGKFMVFSDDIPYCKDIFSILDYCGFVFDYSEGRTEKEDLELMSGCEHHIISNSTFSWWASWLGRNDNKIVVTPHEDNWFGVNNKHLDVSDLLPSNWIRIKY